MPIYALLCLSMVIIIALVANCQENNLPFFKKNIRCVCMVEDRLLTKRELQEYLRISRSTLEQRIMKEIPYIKLGRRVLFKMSDIEKYLESKKIK